MRSYAPRTLAVLDALAPSPLGPTLRVPAHLVLFVLLASVFPRPLRLAPRALSCPGCDRVPAGDGDPCRRGAFLAPVLPRHAAGGGPGL